MNKNLMNNENKGFSLVELIVVIAIMAVLTSVLAPSLLGYVEKSRMQKDDSAMGEVANAIQLALADQNVYDECLHYNLKQNKSCYVDGSQTTETKKIYDKGSEADLADTDKAKNVAWHYGDEVRLKDEKLYTANGQMRGMTITFTSSGGSGAVQFDLAEARINEIKNGTGNVSEDKTGTTLKDMDADTVPTGGTPRATLYNKLRAVIGDNITLSSQTYRNSEYTVFVRMGSLGGNEAGAQDAVSVYGQWNGTNLTAEDYE